MQYDDVVQLFCDGKRSETYGEIRQVSAKIIWIRILTYETIPLHCIHFIIFALKMLEVYYSNISSSQ